LARRCPAASRSSPGQLMYRIRAGFELNGYSTWPRCEGMPRKIAEMRKDLRGRRRPDRGPDLGDAHASSSSAAVASARRPRCAAYSRRIIRRCRQASASSEGIRLNTDVPTGTHESERIMANRAAVVAGQECRTGLGSRSCGESRSVLSARAHAIRNERAFHQVIWPHRSSRMLAPLRRRRLISWMR
jgi:hypothetical protein